MQPQNNTTSKRKNTNSNKKEYNPSKKYNSTRYPGRRLFARTTKQKPWETG